MSKAESYLSSKIKNPKLPLILSVAAATAIDFAVVLTLALAGHSVRTYALPLVSLVLDVLFLIAAAVSNFRFKYSAVYFAIYTVAVVGLAAGTAAIFVSDKIVMSLIAIVAWLLSHALVVAFSFFLQAHASKRLHGATAVNGILALIFAVITMGTAVVYGLYVGNYGFFGQGKERAIAYVYDAESDTFIAQEAFEGGEDTLVIPEKFNGKPVSKVSGKLLCADGIKTIRFETSSFEFTEIDEIGDAEEYRIEARKEDIDVVKKKLYDDGVKYLGNSNVRDRCFAMANAMIPVGLKEDEKYVTFKYSPESYEFLNGDLIPTWFGKSGDTFKVSDIKDIEAFERSDSLSDDDLDWNFKNSRGYIFRDLASNGTKLDDSAISENFDGVEVEFDKIYRVTVGMSNDYQKYKIADFLKKSVVDGESQTFKYVTAANADAFIGAMNSREGFSLSWQYTNGYSALDFSSLEDVLSSRESSDIEIIPVWKMIAPTIDRMVSENSVMSGTYSVIYGEKLEVKCEATPASDEFSMDFTWKKDRDDKAYVDTLMIGSMPYEGGGAYTVYVKTSSVGSDLTATSEYELNVQVDKRPLNIIWTDPADLTYSAENKTIGCRIDESRVINDDIVTWEDNLSSGNFESTSGSFVVKKSGEYTARVKTSGRDGEKYTVASGEDHHTVTIERYKLTAVWSEYDYTYDGDPHTAKVTVSHLLDDVVSARCVQSYTEQGNYTVSATLEGDDKDNYEIENNSQQLVINARPVALTWSEARLEYNGVAQHPEVQSADDLVKDHSVATLSLSYDGWTTNKNAGSGYSVKAIIGNKNYTLKPGGSETHAYSIDKRPLTLVWSASELTYNALPQAPTVTEYQNAVVADVSGLGSGTTYSFNYQDHTDVRSDYTVTADVHNENYVVSETQKNFSIIKAERWASWSGLTVTYNGTAQSPTATAQGFQTDKLTVEISGANKKNVGSYEITATLSGEKADNYSLQNGSQTFKITKCSITVEWGALTHEYNGEKFSPTASVTGVGDDKSRTMGLEIDGEGKDVKRYPVTATLSDETDQGNYDLIGYETNFEITPRDLTLVWSRDTFVYTATAQAPVVNDLQNVVEADRGSLMSSIQYSDFTGHIDVNDAYTVTASIATTNYTLKETTKTYSITQAEVEIKWSDLTLEYKGETLRPTATAAGLENDSLTVVISGADVKNVGQYPVTGTLSGDKAENYKPKGNSDSASFEITPHSVDVEWSALTHEYDAQVYKPTATVTGIGEDGQLQVTVTANGINVDSSHQATAEFADETDKNNYLLGNAETTYEITKHGIEATWTELSQVYCKQDLLPKASVKPLGSDDLRVSVTGSYQAANTYQVTGVLEGAQAGNYTLTNAEQQFVITKRPITAKWENTEQEYNNEDLKPTATVQPLDGDDLRVSVVTAGPGPATSKAIEVYDQYLVAGTLVGDSKDNYELTNGTQSNGAPKFKIIPRKIKLTTDIADFTYDGKGRTFTATATTGGTTLAKDHEIAMLGITFTGTDTNISANTYTVSAQINATYKNSYEILDNSYTYTISKRNIALKWSYDSVVYNGKAQAPTVTSAEELADGDDVSKLAISYSDTHGNIAADNYSVTATLGNGNYEVTDGSDTHAYSITAAEVTLVWDVATLTYNGKSQYPTVKSAGGLQNDEGIAALAIVYSGYENNIAAKAGDEYTLTATITSKNYRLASGKDSEEHSYSIEAKAITLSWGKDSTYTGNAIHPDVTSAEGLENGEQLDSLAISYSEYDSNIAAGNGYTVTATLNNSNYKLADGSSSETHTYSIKAQEVTLVWSSETLTYNGKGQAPTVSSVTGLQNGEQLQVLDIKYSDFDNNINANTSYSVTASTTNENYRISAASATKSYTIAPKAIKLKWSEDQIVENGSAQYPTVTGADGLENDEQVESLLITYEDYEGNITANEGYTVKAKLGNGNYTVTDGSDTHTYAIVAQE